HGYVRLAVAHFHSESIGAPYRVCWFRRTFSSVKGWPCYTSRFGNQKSRPIPATSLDFALPLGPPCTSLAGLASASTTARCAAQAWTTGPQSLTTGTPLWKNSRSLWPEVGCSVLAPGPTSVTPASHIRPRTAYYLAANRTAYQRACWSATPTVPYRSLCPADRYAV